MLKNKFIISLIAVITLASFIIPNFSMIVNAEMIQETDYVPMTQTISTYFESNPVTVPGINSKEATSIVKNMGILSETAKEISSKEKNKLMDVFSSKLDSTIQLHVSEKYLTLDNATALQIISENGENKDYYSLTVPITNEHYNLFSSVTVIFDMMYNIKGVQESLITQSEKDTFEIRTFSNGEEMTHQILEDKFIPNNELKKQLQEVQREFLHLKQARGMAEKAACLAIVLGISRAVANIIAPTCAAACLAVPLVCAACITGFVALAGGAIGGVVACFKL